MTPGKKIGLLIISYHFSPSALVGAKRFSNLSRLFRQDSFDTHVLTVDDAHILQKDESVPHGGTIHRTRMIPPNEQVRGRNLISRMLSRLWVQYIAILDPYCGMIVPGFFKGLGIIKRNEIDVIIASGPPFSAFVLASMLSLATGTKLILDYRDPWSNSDSRYSYSRYERIVTKRVNMLFERLVVTRASAVVLVTDFMKDEFSSRFGKYTRAEIRTITNGFERPGAIEPLFLEEHKKTILYAGSLVYERNISLLADCIKRLVERGLLDEERVAIHIFASLINDRNREAIDAMGRFITVHDPVDYRTALRYMKGSDILYLTSSTEVMYAIPYKFYDYINMERPILAVAPKRSALARLMSEVDCGEFVALEDKRLLEEKLLAMLTGREAYDFSGSDKYSWDALASAYAHVIGEVLK